MVPYLLVCHYWGGEHTIQGTDDVLWSCAPEACNFVNQGHPNRFN